MPTKYKYMKIQNDLLKTIEFLCSRGAYYHTENVINNMIKEPSIIFTTLKTDELKYKTLPDKADIQL